MYNKSDITMIANALVSNEGIDRSIAFSQAHAIAKLKEDLRDFHLVEFKFMKKDGTIRDARGTLHPVILDEYVKGTGTARIRYDVIKYFDLDKNCFRSFKGMNLIA